MRSSVLIAFLVVVVSSSAYGAGNIFGVEIDPAKFHTLGKKEVDAEIFAKLDLVRQIAELAKVVPSNEKTWLNEFRKLVTAEQEIINKLNVPLSQINTECLENISDDELKNKVSEEVFGQLKKGLQDYVNMLKTFDFSQTVWEGRSFLGNPFEEFLGRITAINPEGLKSATLTEAFSKAYSEVKKARNAIFATMASFTKNLDPQYKLSHTVMIEIRNLNLLCIPSTEKKVKKSVKSLATKLKKLQSSIENVNNIPALSCFIEKRAWIDEIRTQLINIDNVHKNLIVQLNRV